MTLGTWDPNIARNKSEFIVDRKLLSRFIEFARNEQLDKLAELLNPAEQQNYVAYMQVNKDDWFEAASPLSNEQIEDLMRFFTVAENLPGWEAGEKSPVIWLGKILKIRGVGINRELLVWIKRHSTNHYLPHGALL